MGRCFHGEADKLLAIAFRTFTEWNPSSTTDLPLLRNPPFSTPTYRIGPHSRNMPFKLDHAHSAVEVTAQSVFEERNGRLQSGTYTTHCNFRRSAVQDPSKPSKLIQCKIYIVGRP
ncbi:hypothetical protein KC19_7G110000 [Ceratodon purpureus]|uniref:Uncharacterized protein n=1 Tax=Ceratodon purpureus TaxID=3225 RepID=A0A8T0H516_CERPU|nr:hypothetical protein KC19_7G110000 [Ceratodon purpureus]